jgi:cell division protein FtsW
MISRNTIRRELHLFLAVIAALVLIGIMFIYSSSSVYCLEQYGNAHYSVKRHLAGIIIGFIGLFIGWVLPITVIKKLAPYAFLSALILTALTLVPLFGHKIHGSSRWLTLAHFTFQPSELLKIMIIIYSAYFLEKNAKRSRTAYPLLLVLVGIASLLLLTQPDFGMAVTIVATVIVLLLCSPFPLRYLALGISMGIPIAIMLIITQPYRIKRILIFLNPWNDPQGAGFQIIQSLIAIGSGGFWGLGIGHSKQKFFYLPMQHTDFIFAIIAEEAGFIGCILVIMLFITLVYTSIRLALKMSSLFAYYTIIGFATITTIQSIINMAVSTGLVPTKGLGLPFISYGNTALVCNLYMVGLIINLVQSNSTKQLQHN